MVISNPYALLEDSVAAPDLPEVAPTLPEPDDVTDKRINRTAFDLVQLRSEFSVERLSTRERLSQMKNEKTAIASEMQKSRHIRRLFDVHHSTPAGSYKVFSHDEDYDSADSYDTVNVRFMSRIELHPDFQRKFWRSSTTNRQLRVVNKLQGSPDWLPVPYVLALDQPAYSEEHLMKGVMQGYWDALQRTKGLWLKSESRSKLLQMTSSLASKHRSITKIVCFGLGAINHSKAWYESSLQHMAAFTIAKQLEKLGQCQVQVIFQDPCYTKKDRKLLGVLYGKGSLSFVTDPDGLLAVDSKTIVMTAFLPVSYPLLQMIADIFHDTITEDPAAIICDSMELDPTRRLYKYTDRSSPEVAEFLTKEYVMQTFKDHALEEELAQDVHGDEQRPNWLSRMQLYTRK